MQETIISWWIKKQQLVLAQLSLKKRATDLLNVEKPARLICGLILHVINFSYPFVDTRNMYSLEGYKEESKYLVFCLSFVSGTKPRALPGNVPLSSIVQVRISQDLNRCKQMMYPIVLILAIKAAGCWMVSAEEINWGSNSQRTRILTSRALQMDSESGQTLARSLTSL